MDFDGYDSSSSDESDQNGEFQEDNRDHDDLLDPTRIPDHINPTVVNPKAANLYNSKSDNDPSKVLPIYEFYLRQQY